MTLLGAGSAAAVASTLTVKSMIIASVVGVLTAGAVSVSATQILSNTSQPSASKVNQPNQVNQPNYAN